MKYLLTTLSVALAMFWGSCANALDPPPNYGRWVIDNAKSLSRNESAKITEKLQAIQRETGGSGKGAQVAVLTVKSLDGDDIKDFALRTSLAWKLGGKRRGSQVLSGGVLILVVKDTAQVRIEVGTGLEGALTDARTSLLIREHFARGAGKTIGVALRAMIDEIAKDIRREYNVQPSAVSEPLSPESEKKNGDARLILFGLATLVAGVFGAVFHRRRRFLRYWFGGVLGGISWFGVATLYAFAGYILGGIVLVGYVLGYLLSAIFRHGGDGWLFDPFPRYYGGGGSGQGGEALRGGGGDFAGGGADGGADPGLFDGVGEAVSNISPPGDCPDLGGCDVGGCG